MNTRKPTDYSAMYGTLDQLMGARASADGAVLRDWQGRLCPPEKGAAVMAAEYLQENYPESRDSPPKPAPDRGVLPGLRR